MKRTRVVHRLIGVTFLLLMPSPLLADDFAWLRSWADTSYVAAVAAAPDGESYAAGEFLEGSLFITRLDRRGNRIWTQVLTQDPISPFSPGVTIYDAAATPDGVVVVGLLRESRYVSFGWVQAYDRLGNLKWTRQYSFDSGNGANGVAVDAVGNVYVAGHVGGAASIFPPGPDAFLLKYDSAGNVLWTRRFGHQFLGDALYDVAVSPDETIYIVGYVSVDLPPPMLHSTSSFVSAYDADGTELWTQMNDAFFTRVAAAMGTFYVTNAQSVRRFSAAGAELWTVNPVATEISGVAVDGGGNPYLAGYLNETVFAEALDLDGVQRWRLDFGAGGGSFIHSLDVNAESEVFVGGSSAFRDEPLAGFVAKIGPDIPMVDVAVDIRPGSAINQINLRSRGVVPVAILTTPDFNATTVVADRVCFGDAEDGGQRDCTETHGTGHLEDVDGDGDLDLVLHYETGKTGIDRGDAIACLTGETVDGIAITGCDTVTVR